MVVYYLGLSWVSCQLALAYTTARLRARPGAVPATVVPVVPLGEPVYDTVIDPV